MNKKCKKELFNGLDTPQNKSNWCIKLGMQKISREINCSALTVQAIGLSLSNR